MFYFSIGLVLGSFISLAVDRIPNHESLLLGSSHCDHCKKKLRKIDLIPLVSYLLLKGKCRFCGLQIGINKPIIELSTAFFIVLTAYSKQNFFEILFSLSLTTILLLISFIDIKTLLIPYRFQFIMLGLGILLSIVDEVTIQSRMVGLFSVSSLFLIIALLTQGMGGGDVLLMASAGFLLGVNGILITFIIATLTASFYGILARQSKEIPFAPFICFGIFIAYHYSNEIFFFYQQFLSINAITS